jgi:hypothetical protein
MTPREAASLNSVRLSEPLGAVDGNFRDHACQVPRLRLRGKPLSLAAFSEPPPRRPCRQSQQCGPVASIRRNRPVVKGSVRLNDLRVSDSSHAPMANNGFANGGEYNAAEPGRRRAYYDAEEVLWCRKVNDIQEAETR